MVSPSPMLPSPPLPPGTVRVISIPQPLASLLISGASVLINRPGCTQVRGPVYIHASKERSVINRLVGKGHPPFVAAMERVLGIPRERWQTELVKGAVIGRAHLTGCFSAEAARDRFPDQLAFCDLPSGSFAYRFQAMNSLPVSIPFRGRKGMFFHVPEAEFLAAFKPLHLRRRVSTAPKKLPGRRLKDRRLEMAARKLAAVLDDEEKSQDVYTDFLAMNRGIRRPEVVAMVRRAQVIHGHDTKQLLV